MVGEKNIYLSKRLETFFGSLQIPGKKSGMLENVRENSRMPGENPVCQEKILNGIKCKEKILKIANGR